MRSARADAEFVKREFWKRVAVRNGIAPKVPVAPRGFPWVAVAIGACLVVALAVLSYVGWSFALGLVLFGATWSVR